MKQVLYRIFFFLLLSQYKKQDFLYIFSILVVFQTFLFLWYYKNTFKIRTQHTYKPPNIQTHTQQRTKREIYTWPVNNARVRDADLYTVENLCTTFDCPQTQIPLYQWGIGSRTHLWIPKCKDAEGPFIKRCRTMIYSAPCTHRFPVTDGRCCFHSIGWIHSCKPRDREGPLYIYWKKSYINGPSQFKPMLCKGQIYIIICTISAKNIWNVQLVMVPGNLQ